MRTPTLDHSERALPPGRARNDRPSWLQVLGGAGVLDELGDELDELHAATGVPITGRRRWLHLWIEAFPTWEPWAIVVRSARGTLDAAALLAWRRRFGVTEITALGQGPSDYVRLPARDMAAAGRLATELAAELATVRRPWRLSIADLPHADPVAADLASRLRHCVVAPGDASPATVFDRGRSADAYASSKYRGQARRKREQLGEAAGGTDIRFTTDPATVAELRPVLEATRLARDVDLGRLGDLDTHEGNAFWWAALPELAAAGELELATLWAGSDLAAYSVALLDGPVYRSWDFRMSPTWGAFNPGRILDVAVIERALADERYQVLDRMRGEEQYKMRTANTVARAEGITAWSSGWFERAAAMATGAKDVVRRNERLIESWRLVRRKIRGRLPDRPSEQ